MTSARASRNARGARGDPRLPRNASRRLDEAQVAWLASIRKSGRPHLVPLWYVWIEGAFYVCIAPSSIKARNLVAEPRVVIALEDGTKPLICEGRAEQVAQPWPADVLQAFEVRYDWKIDGDREYTRLVRILPDRWLSW